MSKDTNVDVSQRLKVCEAVAAKLHTAGSRQQIDTRRDTAEKLLSSGYIDVPVVLEDLEPEVYS